MNESDIRARVHVAFGEATYPAALRDRVAGRIAQPSRRDLPRAYGIVAAILALALIATLVVTRFGPLMGTSPAFRTNQVVGPVDPNAQLPDADLRNAYLDGAAADLVSPLNLTAEDGGVKLALIGAYADDARTVMIFRTFEQFSGSIHVELYDQTGFLNYGGAGNPGAFGDSVVEAMGPVHPDSAGVSHVRVAVDNLQPEPGTEGTSGYWGFSFALKVQTPTALRADPALTSIGSMKIEVEAIDLTPTVVHFQARIPQVRLEQISNWKATLVDAQGQTVAPGASSMEYTGAALLPFLPNTTPARINYTWKRPPAGDYELTVGAPGSSYTGRLTIPPFVPPRRRTEPPVNPAAFPPANESIVLSGPFSAAVTLGLVSGCDEKGGNLTFGTWFQHEGAWYQLAFTTQGYGGPGTYAATIALYPFAPYGAAPLFTGAGQVTINAGRSPTFGTIRGSLDWFPSAAGSTLNVAGDWRC